MQNPNQFGQTVEKGLLDLVIGGNIIPCRVYSSEATPLVRGQAVKLHDTAGGTPIVTAVTADTDKIFGYVPYSQKDISHAAGASLEIAFQGALVYLEASAAIARGAKVMAVVSGNKVATATAGKSIVGFAFDKAAADGDLVRIYLQPFSEEVISGTAANVPAVGGVLTGTVDGDVADIADIVMASALALSTGDTYTDAAVNTAVNAAVDSAVDTAVNGAILEANLQNKELQTSLNLVIAALIAAGLMSA